MLRVVLKNTKLFFQIGVVFLQVVIKKICSLEGNSKVGQLENFFEDEWQKKKQKKTFHGIF